jgi:hypothetical protein
MKIMPRVRTRLASQAGQEATNAARYRCPGGLSLPHPGGGGLFVDDKQFDGGELRLEFEQTPLVAPFHQLMNEPGRREEGNGEAMLAGGQAERQTIMRLAGAIRDSDIMPGTGS